MTPAELIRRYYKGCTAGDLDELHATLHPDVVHYFLAPDVGSAPVTGAEHLARYWRKVTRMLDGFRYPARGYSVPGQEHSTTHPDAERFHAPLDEDEPS